MSVKFISEMDMGKAVREDLLFSCSAPGQPRVKLCRERRAQRMVNTDFRVRAVGEKHREGCSERRV